MLVGHPFNVIKTRLQSMNSAKSIGQQVQQLEWSGMYKGVIPPLLTYGLWSSFSFAGFEWGKRITCLGKPRDEVPILVQWLGGRTECELARTQIFLSGAIGGMTATIVHPTNVLSSLQMVNDKPGSSSARKTIALVAELWQVEGLRAWVLSRSRVSVVQRVPGLRLLFLDLHGFERRTAGGACSCYSLPRITSLLHTASRPASHHLT
jgi:hypothetical protein